MFSLGNGHSANFFVISSLARLYVASICFGKVTTVQTNKLKLLSVYFCPFIYDNADIF